MPLGNVRKMTATQMQEWLRDFARDNPGPAYDEDKDFNKFARAAYKRMFTDVGALLQSTTFNDKKRETREEKLLRLLLSSYSLQQVLGFLVTLERELAA